jgi:hypothetical protein
MAYLSNADSVVAIGVPAKHQDAEVAVTALKRLESESGLKVREDTRGQVHRALENAGIVFLASEQGEGVMLVRNPGGARGASRRGKFGRNMTTP